MQFMPPPSYSVADIFDACVDSMQNNAKNNFLPDRLKQIRDNVISASEDYKSKAEATNLFLIEQNNSRGDCLVAGSVVKEELRNLYDTTLLNNKRPRMLYEILQNDLWCPFCDIVQADTLDHFLPKSKYPFFSILPDNLVPCCAICNQMKGDGVANSKGEQFIHPYFDKEPYESEEWLFAEVIRTKPISMNFYVAVPAVWKDFEKERLIKHFDEFHLNKRYQHFSSNEVTTILDLLRLYSDDAMLKKLLKSFRETAPLNSWKYAMYNALLHDEWFCSMGHKQDYDEGC